MAHGNIGLIILFLGACVGHAEVLEALTHRQEPFWHAGIALLILPLMQMLLGPMIAEESQEPRWVRLGWRITVAGAVLHLLLDLSCASLFWLRPIEWKTGVGGAVLGALGAGWVLLQGLRGLRPRRPGATQEGPPRPLSPLWREIDLIGGNAIAVTLIGTCFVLAGLYALLHRRGAASDLKLWAAVAFFAVVATAGVWMGLERRALLLGEPGPRLFRLPRWLRAGGYHIAREGLVELDRRGMTLIPWEALETMELGTVFNNAAVLLTLRDPEQYERRWGKEVPQSRRDAYRRSRGRGTRVTRSLYGADLLIMGVLCEEGPGVLHRQLLRGLADPPSRRDFPSAEDMFRGRFPGMTR